MRRERDIDAEIDDEIQRTIDDRNDLVDEAFRDILAGRFDSYAIREVTKGRDTTSSFVDAFIRVKKSDGG